MANAANSQLLLDYPIFVAIRQCKMKCKLAPLDIICEFLRRLFQLRRHTASRELWQSLACSSIVLLENNQAGF